MEYKPKVLIINGSPRKYGSSAQLAEVAVLGIKEAGGTPEVIHIYDYNIKPCIGCVSDNVKYCKFPCIIEDDDFNGVAEKTLEADGIIISTPVYWYAPSGMLKNFIDRLTSMENMIFHAGRSLLEGKVVGFIVTGLDSGVFMAVAYLMSVLNSMGAVVAPWSMAYTHLDDVTKDEGALKDAYNVGYLVTETIKAIKSYGGHLGYRADVNVRNLAEVVEKYRANMREEQLRRVSSMEAMLFRGIGRGKPRS
ncbi:MAG: flavodoxin family protein [Desulfurococcaceae archaeon]